MLIRIHSDVVCPWCWIGKRRLERAMEMFAADGGDTSAIHLEWVPFQLDPDAPGTPMPVTEAYARKFGGEQRAAAIIAQITEVAASEGLDFRLDIAQRANTFDAHRVLWLAGRQGRQAEVKERLMKAYFTEGRDVGAIDVLVHCGVDAGLQADEVAALLGSDLGRAEVTAAIHAGRAAGVTAVPTFVFHADDSEGAARDDAGAFALPGAQDPATIARILGRLAGQA